MKSVSKNARKAKLKKIYDAADQAEQAKDLFRMYQAIGKLTPKQTFRIVTLRSDNGELLGPDQAADALCQWFSELYHSDQPQPEGGEFAWPFTQAEFQHGLEQLPFSKVLDRDLLLLRFGGGQRLLLLLILMNIFMTVLRRTPCQSVGDKDIFVFYRRLQSGVSSPRT